VPVEALVLFGATGDLAHRKLLPALFQLSTRDELPCSVIGVALDQWSDHRLRQFSAEAIGQSTGEVNQDHLDAFLRKLSFVAGDYADDSTFRALADRLGTTRPLMHYLAVPPGMVPTVIGKLANVGLLEKARVLAEKPFGRDLASARELNRVMLEVLPEESIYRIDHYLAKESIENLMVFRFGNALFEPLWNRAHVANIQVTMAEEIGVEGRGGFYDSVGAVRDVVQNHLLHVIALLAMEPPAGRGPEDWRMEISRLLRAVRPVRAHEAVRGQYHGYLEEAGVRSGSQTETYAALRLEIDSWRWAGVPIYVRAGKGLRRHALEAVVEFREPPQHLFAGDAALTSANLIRFCLGTGPGVDLRLRAKQLGPTLRARDVDLRVDFAQALGVAQEPYERLLHDAVHGDIGRFAHQDAVEQQWRIIQPLLDDPGPVVGYPRGTWGPLAAGQLPGARGWYEPLG
jgi:glucose-6-phosphate 1-dehydrogenase